MSTWRWTGLVLSDIIFGIVSWVFSASILAALAHGTPNEDYDKLREILPGAAIDIGVFVFIALLLRDLVKGGRPA